MVCPVCQGKASLENLKGTLDMEYRDVTITGHIEYIIDPKQIDTYKPFEKIYTVVLRGKHPTTTYLKLTEEELREHPELREAEASKPKINVSVRAHQHKFYKHKSGKKHGEGSLAYREGSNEKTEYYLFLDSKSSVTIVH